MRFFFGVAVFLGLLTISCFSLSAAPISQVICIYETVAPDKLPEFGKAAIGEVAEEGLDPVFNAAQNACIAQYGWSEIDATNAGAYFSNRVARERLMALVGEIGLDARKLERAYNSIRVLPRGKQKLEINDDIVFLAALQKQGFPIDDAELLRAAFGYFGLRDAEERAQMAFADGSSFEP
jgi:hypothetical protein